MKHKKEQKRMRQSRNDQRVFKHFNNDLSGLQIDLSTDAIVIDQLRYGGKLYVAAEEKSGEVTLYRIVALGNYMPVGSERVLGLQDVFSEPAHWRHHSKFNIGDDGRIFVTRRFGRKNKYE